jgi:membrane protein implicated in regulation of membrane protease activity
MTARRILMALGLVALLALLVGDVLEGAFLWAGVAWLALSLNAAVVLAAWRGRAARSPQGDAAG